MVQLQLLDGDRDQLVDEMGNAIFRGICLGEKEQFARFMEIDSILSRRGELRLIFSRAEPPMAPADAGQ